MKSESTEFISREDLEQENSRLRGDLLTMARRVSHDLRTPLGGIITTGEALKELAEEQKTSTELAVSLLSSAEEITRLIKRTSFVLKATVDPPANETVAMSGVVSGVLQQLESRILKQNATIVEPASWPMARGVPTWLEVIWWNLLANALQHAGESPRIELGWQVEGQNLRFMLSDNGSGVPPMMRQKLFQPFHTLHEINSAPGLGLPIVHRLVRLLGGYCGYEPIPNSGACFFFVLPAAGN